MCDTKEIDKMSAVNSRKNPVSPDITAPPPLAKRLKRMDSTDVGTCAASALDLESDSVPDLLRCPICMEVPLGEVFQCPNGHPICQPCQNQSAGSTCSQCKETMTTEKGKWIRCRVLEQLLDSHSFLCPFQKNGCEDVLPREDLLKHKENCVYDGNHIQLCKYLRGEDCPVWIGISKPKEAVEHLTSHLNDLTVTLGPGKGWCFLDVKPNGNVWMEGFVTYLNGGTFLTLSWSHDDTEQLSFACLRMDKPVPGELEEPTMARLTFENQNKDAKILNWSVNLPIVSVLEAQPVLERKLISVSRRYLEEKFFKEDNVEEKGFEATCLKVEIEIL